MTHEYTLLIKGTVIAGLDAPDATAIAWAGDTVLAIGGDAEVRAISRGDSHVVDLAGATVVPLMTDHGAGWPVDATLEVGGPADMAVLDRDPRSSRPASDAVLPTIAEIRAGRVVSGRLPGTRAGDGHSAAHRD